MTAATTPAFGWRSRLALLLALSVLIGLGTWQLQRRTWKEGVLADIAARGQAAPLVSLPERGCHACDYRRISLAVRLLPDTERHVFISVPMQVNGIGGPGYWIFVMAEASGERFYVNRGFVPQRDKSTPRPVPVEPVRIDGIVRTPEPRGTFSNANDSAGNTYYVRAPLEFGGGVTRPDVYIDMTGPTPPGGLPLPMVGRIAIPNRHLEYALTWYALALTLVGVAIAMNRR